MHTFIDEAGRAITSEKKPVACVTALIVPDAQVDELNKWFQGIEQEKGELIKGRKLDLALRRRILTELRQLDVFVEYGNLKVEISDIHLFITTVRGLTYRSGTKLLMPEIMKS